MGLLLTMWWPVSRAQDSQVTVPGPRSFIGWRREFPHTARLSVFNSWILSLGLTCPVFSAWYGTAKSGGRTTDLGHAHAEGSERVRVADSAHELRDH
jgi:hypothetical protein